MAVQQTHVRWQAWQSFALLLATLLVWDAGASLGAVELGSQTILAEIDASASVSRAFPRLARAGGGVGTHERRSPEWRSDRSSEEVPADVEIRPHSWSSLPAAPPASYLQTGSTPEASTGCPEATLHSDPDDFFFLLPNASRSKASFADSFQLKKSEACEGDAESNSVFLVQSVNHLDEWEDARVVVQISKPLPHGTFYICPVPSAEEKEEDGDPMQASSTSPAPEEGQGTSQEGHPKLKFPLNSKAKTCLASITYEGNFLSIFGFLHQLLDLGVAGTTSRAFNKNLETQDTLQTHLVITIVLFAIIFWILAAFLSFRGLWSTWRSPRELPSEDLAKTPCIQPFSLSERTRGSFIQMFSFVMGNVGLVGVALRCMFIDVQPWLLNTILLMDAFVGSLGLFLLGQELYVQQLYDVVAGKGRCLLDQGGMSSAELCLIAGFGTICLCLFWGWKQLEDRATLFGISSGFLAVLMAILRLRQTRQKRAKGLYEVSLPELSELLMCTSRSGPSFSSTPAPAADAAATGDAEADADADADRLVDVAGKLKLLNERIGVPLHIGTFCKDAREGVDPLRQESSSSAGRFGVRDVLWQPRYIYEVTGSRWAFANLFVLLGMYVLLLVNLAELKLYFQILTPEVEEFTSSQGLLVPAFSPDIRKYNFLYDSLGRRNGTKTFTFFSRGLEETVRRQHFKIGKEIQSISVSDLVRLTDIGGRNSREVEVEVVSGKNGLFAKYDFSFAEVTYHIGTILYTSESSVDVAPWKRCQVWDPAKMSMTFTFNGAVHFEQEWEIRVFPYVRGVPISMAEVPEEGLEMITVVHPLDDDQLDGEGTAEERCYSACSRMETCKTFEATESACFFGVLPSHKTSLSQSECEALHAVGVPPPTPGSPLDSLLKSRVSSGQLCNEYDANEPCVTKPTTTGSLNFNVTLPLMGSADEMVTRFSWLIKDKYMQEAAVVSTWEIRPLPRLPFPDLFVASAERGVQVSALPPPRLGVSGSLMLNYNPRRVHMNEDWFEVLILLQGVDRNIAYSVAAVGNISSRTWTAGDYDHFHLKEKCKEEQRFRLLSICKPSLVGEPTEAYYIFNIDKWKPDASESLAIKSVWQGQGFPFPGLIRDYQLQVRYAPRDPPAAVALQGPNCNIFLPGNEGARFSSTLRFETFLKGAAQCGNKIGLRTMYHSCETSFNVEYRDFIRMGLGMHQAPDQQVRLLETAAKAVGLETTGLVEARRFSREGCEGIHVPRLRLFWALDSMQEAMARACVPWMAFVMHGQHAPILWLTELPKLWPVLPQVVPKLVLLAIQSQPEKILLSTMRSLFAIENWGPKAKSTLVDAVFLAIKTKHPKLLSLLLENPEAWNLLQEEGATLALYDHWVERAIAQGCVLCVQAFVSACNNTRSDMSSAADAGSVPSARAATCARWMHGSRSRRLPVDVKVCHSDETRVAFTWQALQVWWRATQSYKGLSLAASNHAFSDPSEFWTPIGQLDGMKFIDIEFSSSNIWNTTEMTPWVSWFRQIRFMNEDLPAPTVAEFLSFVEPNATKLRSLALNYARLDADGVEVLSGSPILEQLAVLDLGSNPGLGSRGLQAALSLATLGSRVDFKSLMLNANDEVDEVEDEVEEEKSRSKASKSSTGSNGSNHSKDSEETGGRDHQPASPSEEDRMEGPALKVNHIGLEQDSFNKIGSAKLLEKLWHFDISYNSGLGMPGLKKVFEVLKKSSVQRLILRGMEVFTPSNLQDLGSSSFLEKLRYLDLQGNSAEMGWEGTLQLCQFPATLTIRISLPGPHLSDPQFLEKFQNCKPSLYISNQHVPGPNWGESALLRRFAGA